MLNAFPHPVIGFVRASERCLGDRVGDRLVDCIPGVLDEYVEDPPVAEGGVISITSISSPGLIMESVSGRALTVLNGLVCPDCMATTT